MSALVDVIIVLLLLAGAGAGFKKGLIRSATEFFGILTIIVASYYFKNPVSEFLYTNMPFFNFSGAIEGVTVLNIIIYEVIAYILVLLVLLAIVRIIIALTGFLEFLLRMTILLSIPSKILGLVFGACEMFIIIFVALFCINQIALANNKTIDSKLAPKILSSTPLLSKGVATAYDTVEEIIAKASEYEDTENKNEYNKEALDILLKNKIITVDAAQKLVDKEKLQIDGVKEIINKYKGSDNND